MIDRPCAVVHCDRCPATFHVEPRPSGVPTTFSRARRIASLGGWMWEKVGGRAKCDVCPACVKELQKMNQDGKEENGRN